MAVHNIIFHLSKQYMDLLNDLEVNSSVSINVNSKHDTNVTEPSLYANKNADDSLTIKVGIHAFATVINDDMNDLTCKVADFEVIGYFKDAYRGPADVNSNAFMNNVGTHSGLINTEIDQSTEHFTESPTSKTYKTAGNNNYQNKRDISDRSYAVLDVTDNEVDSSLFEFDDASELDSNTPLPTNTSQDVLYTCGICSAEVKRRYIRRHCKSKHSDDPNYSTCLSDLEQKAELKKYTRNMVVPCKVCNKSFSSDEHVYTHLRKRHKNVLKNKELQPYVNQLKAASITTCPVCHVSIHKYSMRQHMLYKHSAAENRMKRVSCEQCQKTFDRQDLLDVHNKRVHKGELALCHKCPAVYRQRSSLLEHIKNCHVDGVQYKCAQCGKVLSSSRILRRHIQQVHQEQVKGRCPQCNKKFSDLHNMHRHIQLVHNKDQVERLPCPHCIKTFSTKHNRKQHIDNVHNKVVCKSHSQVPSLSYSTHLSGLNNSDSVMEGSVFQKDNFVILQIPGTCT